MHHRPPRPGDFLTIRARTLTAAHDHHGVIRAVADDGRTLTFIAEYGAHRLDVEIRRVGHDHLENRMSAVIDELKNVVDLLKNEEHALADRLEAIWAHLVGEVPAVKAEVEADVEKVAGDAEVAVAPVEAEAVKAAEGVAGEVVADVEHAAEGK